MESAWRVFLPGGVFLPCDHRLNFDIRLCENSIKFIQIMCTPTRIYNSERIQIQANGRNIILFSRKFHSSSTNLVFGATVKEGLFGGCRAGLTLKRCNQLAVFAI